MREGRLREACFWRRQDRLDAVEGRKEGCDLLSGGYSCRLEVDCRVRRQREDGVTFEGMESSWMNND